MREKKKYDKISGFRIFTWERGSLEFLSMFCLLSEAEASKQRPETQTELRVGELLPFKRLVCNTWKNSLRTKWQGSSSPKPLYPPKARCPVRIHFPSFMDREKRLRKAVTRLNPVSQRHGELVLSRVRPLPADRRGCLSSWSRRRTRGEVTPSQGGCTPQGLLFLCFKKQ